MSSSNYECKRCKKKIMLIDDKKTPSCCGEPMKKTSVNICLQPDHAEHSRPMDDEEPCDDFRGGT